MKRVFDFLSSIGGLIALAVIGLALLWIPAQIVALWQAAAEMSPFWRTAYLTTVGLGTAILLGLVGYVGFLLWRRSLAKRRRAALGARSPSELSEAEKKAEYAQNLERVEELSRDETVPAEVRAELDQLAKGLEKKRESRRLEIVAFGTVSSGKSSLLNALAGKDVFDVDLKGGTTIRRQEIPWPGEDQVFLVDTPGLAEVDGAGHARVATEAAQDADVVLVVVDGPLRDSEHQLLRTLDGMEKRAIVCLNKEDWYAESDRQELIGQIVRQTAPFSQKPDVVAVRSQATTRTRVRVTSGGEEIEESVPVPPEIGPLAKRMMEVVARDGHDLLLANLLLRSRGLVADARMQVAAALDERAWALVNRYAWAAGGAAALSPLPIVDLAAGSAVTTKMILDLAPIYRQQVDLQTVGKMLREMGRNLIGWLGVQLTAPALTMGIASLLKTVPFAGQVAGGTLQGVTQALVTRWIGAVFIEWFKNESQPPEGGLAGLAQREWKRLTSLSELKRLVDEARDQFKI